MRPFMLAALSMLLLRAFALPAHPERGAEGTFSVFGAWMMVSETAPDGKESPSIYTQYTRCKIYDPDSTYYSVQLHAVGDEMMIIAHEMGRYRLNDSVYIENGREMPFEWVNDTTFITIFQGYKETMVRSSTITAERMEEIRELVRKYPDSANSPVKHFVFSTTERQLKQTNRFFLYIIIGMGILAVGVAVYVHRLRQRKRAVERKLAEMEEERTLRPEVVADAMKLVESEFFQSDYLHSPAPAHRTGRQHQALRVERAGAAAQSRLSPIWQQPLRTLQPLAHRVPALPPAQDSHRSCRDSHRAQQGQEHHQQHPQAALQESFRQGRDRKGLG